MDKKLTLERLMNELRGHEKVALRIDGLGETVHSTKEVFEAIFGTDQPNDVVRVTRCKDCKYFELTGKENGFCIKKSGRYAKVYFLADFYCSYGERKAND